MNATRIDEIHRLPRATETAKTRESCEPTCLDLAGLHSTNPKKSIRDGVLPASRHVELLELLQTQGQATINELATWLGVSDATVRRDLDRLAGQKRLTRTYGGAMVNGGALPCSLGFGDRMHAPERRIAQAVCQLIGDGETLLVNAGVTVRRIVSELAQKRLTVITNDLCLPAALPQYIQLVANDLGWASVPPGTRQSTYENPEYQKAAPFAQATLKSMQTADPTNPCIQEVPYTGITFVGIPEYQAFGTMVGQNVAGIVTGKSTLEQTLKLNQERVERAVKQAGYLK